MANTICAVVAEKTICRWFARFKAGDFDLEDQEHPGRSSVTDENLIKPVI